MRTIKILLLISTVVFGSDLGPLHTFEYIRIAGTASTILFGITSYMMFRRADENRRLKWFGIVTGILCIAAAVLTIIAITSGTIQVYDLYSVLLLLPAIINLILAFVLLRE